MAPRPAVPEQVHVPASTSSNFEPLHVSELVPSNSNPTLTKPDRPHRPCITHASSSVKPHSIMAPSSERSGVHACRTFCKSAGSDNVRHFCLDTTCEEHPCRSYAIRQAMRNGLKLPISSAVTLELCAGSAGLTCQLRARGMDGLGVDWVRNPQRPKAPIVKVILASPEGQDIIMDVLQQANVAYVHIAVPCGTATRARDKPLPTHLLAKGFKSPPPLRSAEFPWGLPTLQGIQKQRVIAANSIYRFAARVIKFCHAHGILWSLENPKTSYFWILDIIAELFLLPDVFDYLFQQCCHGGDRPVWRRWLSSAKALQVLVANCQNDHPHKPFSMRITPAGIQYDTAEEATYPLQLCRLVADGILEELLEQGYEPQPASIKDSSNSTLRRHKVRAATGKFVRGNRLPQLISEFSHVETVPFSALEVCREGSVVPLHGHFAKILRQFHGVNVGAQNNVARKIEAKADEDEKLFDVDEDEKLFVVEDSIAKATAVLDAVFPPQAPALRPNPDSGLATQADERQVVVGIYRTPQQFAEAASSLVHPIDMDAPIPDCLKRNIFFILCNPPEALAKFRLERIKEISLLGKQLLSKNEELVRDLPPAAKKILANRNLALFDALINNSDYPDKQLVPDIIKGMQLTGNAPKSEFFEPKLRMASIDANQLKSSAVWMRRATAGKVSANDPIIDESVWKQTLDEASEEKGWLSGPFTEEEVSARLGHDNWICSRRFGVDQGNKIRCIDDFSESSVNATITTYEKVGLDLVDDFVGVLKFIMSSVDNDGTVHVTLGDGSTLFGRLPVGTSQEQALTWVCKTFDLKSAYRQLPTRDEESWLTNLAVYDPVNNCCKFFMLHALPFGAVGAVVGFNRLARALWAIGAFYLTLVWTDFYDDYSSTEPLRSAEFCDIVVKKFFSILGWQLALEDKKCKPYDFEFAMLGVVCDCSGMPAGKIDVKNKPERVAGITEQIDGVLANSLLPKPLTSELKGKAQFASNQIFGRIANGPIHALNEHEFRSFSPLICDYLRDQLLLLKEILLTCPPRTLSVTGETRPLLVFSDGACEGEQFGKVTVGAVIFDTISKKAKMFGDTVPNDLVEVWKSEGKIQTIGQAEILPVVLSRIAFEEEMRHRRVFYFIDNDSARMALIRGCSNSHSSMKLISVMIQLECKTQSWAWFARVPTHSNPGDGPSRLRLVPHPENLNAEVIQCPPISAALFGDERLAK